jgi:hypothetical protein
VTELLSDLFVMGALDEQGGQSHTLDIEDQRDSSEQEEESEPPAAHEADGERAGSLDVSPLPLLEAFSSPAGQDALPPLLAPPSQPLEPHAEVAPEPTCHVPAARLPKRQNSRSLSCGANVQAIKQNFCCTETAKELPNERPTVRFRKSLQEVMEERRLKLCANEARGAVA